MKPRMRFLLAMPILAALALPAWADDHDHHDRDRDRDHHDHDRYDHRDRRDHRDFHGHDFRFFTPFELSLWTGGGWAQEWHDGRLAWWWVVDGVWYWYPQPIYPYPTYIPEPVVMAPPPPAPPPAVIYAAPPPPPAVIYVAPPPPPPRPTFEIDIPIHIR
jgi:hypothetical protein